MRISFIGLGKLGLCSAGCFAAKGHQVIGVDTNPVVMAALKASQCPIDETGLEDLLKQGRSNLSFVEDAGEAVSCTDVTMIIVPTPSKNDGCFSNDYVETVLRQIAPALAAKNTFHVVDVVSTVMPGSCDNLFIPLLEELTGKICGKDFGFVYNPEFIALGSVIRNFLNPDMVLIGASDDCSGKIIRDTYCTTVESAPHYAIMSLINAEITKLSLNCYVTMKISFANELTALCEKISGANVDVVTNAIGADSRVGKKYLKGGLGFGGPCFPRDNVAFLAAGRSFGYEPQLAPQVVAVNKAVPTRVLAHIQKNVSPGATVALFGVSYKRDTHIVEESQTIMLAERLLAKGYGVRLHDDHALDAAREQLHGDVSYHKSPYEAAEGVSCIALLVDAPEFASYDWEKLASVVATNALLLDAWRIFSDRDMKKFHYLPLGVGIR